MIFNFDFQPKIKKSEIQDLVTLRFLDTYDNLLFIGNSGVGKTGSVAKFSKKSILV